MNKPYSQACENNKQPILEKLIEAFSDTQQVLEIGSGTGQHASFFGGHLPHLHWQTSDLSVNHEGINQWINDSGCTNVSAPIELDLNESWSLSEKGLIVDGLYTANTLHIVSWNLVVKFFAGISENLNTNAKVCIYGPFNYDGKFTSESNASFDLWLKDRDPNSGIRDMEAILSLAEEAGLSLLDDHAMPANNRLLVFIKG